MPFGVSRRRDPRRVVVSSPIHYAPEKASFKFFCVLTRGVRGVHVRTGSGHPVLSPVPKKARDEFLSRVLSRPKFCLVLIENETGKSRNII